MSTAGSIPMQACPSSESTSDQIVPSSFPGKSSSRSGLLSVARLVKLGRCRNILVVVGAGISTPSGIPDFRSVSLLYFLFLIYDFTPSRCGLSCGVIFKSCFLFLLCFFGLLSWHVLTRALCCFQDSRNGSLRQPGEVQHPLPWSHFQHRLLLQRPPAFLLLGQGFVSWLPPSQLHPLLHSHAPPQRSAAPAIHAEHRWAGERWVRTQTNIQISTTAFWRCLRLYLCFYCPSHLPSFPSFPVFFLFNFPFVLLFFLPFFLIVCGFP